MFDDLDLLRTMALAGNTSANDTYSSENSLERHVNGIKDAFNNSVLGIGASDHIAQFNDYTFENSTLNWFLWLALYNESWVFRRTIDKPSQDMIRPSISLQGSADFSKVYKQLDLLKPDLIDAVKWSKLFGGSVMVMLFKGVSFDDMAKPIDYNKIKGCRAIRSYVTDRWFGCSPSYDDIVSNLANDDFGKPKYYDIQFADGTSHTIHHSWILRFENRGAPQLIKTGQLQGWGYAEGAHILHELSRDEKLKNSIQSLIDKSLIEVIKMPGMRGVFMGSDKGNEEQLKKRLEMVNWARNFNSLTFLDSDDSYEEHGFNGLSGLADMLDLNMRQIAAAVEMPNVLYGDLSNGFTSDDSALERYDEKILNDDETYLRKPMTKLVKMLYKVYNVVDQKGNLMEVSFSFNSIIAEKKNQNKLQEFGQLKDACDGLVKSKLMTAEQEIASLQEYLDTGSVNIHLLVPTKQAIREVKKSNDIQGGDMNANPMGGNNFDNSFDNDFGNDDFGNDEGDLNLGSSRLASRPTPEGNVPTEPPTSPENAPNPPENNEGI